MKDLRPLLIDCRIELRKSARDFQKTDLCERLDLAIQTLANAPAAAEGADAPAPMPEPVAAGKAGKQTTSQVALAWQTAARDLRFTDPALYERMGEKVMRLLETRSLVDPVTELKQLGDEVAALRAQIETAARAQAALEDERDTLLGALASAVPDLAESKDRVAVALARIDWLRAHGAAPKAAGAGGSGKPAGVPVPPPEGPVPTNEILNAVAAGARQLSKEQREWCVGEAMVLSGFQYTPVELIEKGDDFMARIVLDARKPA